MRDSESRSASSRYKDRKDREHSRDRRRSKERERKNRDSGRDRDRRDRDNESRYGSKSKKYKNSKSSKKYTRRSRSSSQSSSSSSSSRSSYSSSSSRDSRSSHRSRKSSSCNAKTRSSSDSNSRPAAASMPNKQITNIVVKNIDLRNEGTQKALETIEEDRFEQQMFYSTRDREAPVLDRVFIDLNTETVTVSKPLPTNHDVAESKSLIHPRFLADDDLRQEKWIRKLFAYRQKYHEEYDD